MKFNCYATKQQINPHHSHCTVSEIALLVLVGQLGSDPPSSHTPEATTVTLQVYGPVEETFTGDMEAVLL